MRWKDLVPRYLRNCNLDGVWRILAEDRNEWRNQIWAATQEVNFKKENKRNTARMSRNVTAKQGKRHQSLLYTAALVVVDLLL